MQYVCVCLCACVCRGRAVVCALVRVLGTGLAEMPLVATRLEARRQGHCRVLLHALENMLVKLGVRVLALPATADAVSFDRACVWRCCGSGLTATRAVHLFSAINGTFMTTQN